MAEGLPYGDSVSVVICTCGANVRSMFRFMRSVIIFSYYYVLLAGMTNSIGDDGENMLPDRLRLDSRAGQTTVLCQRAKKRRKRSIILHSVFEGSETLVETLNLTGLWKGPLNLFRTGMTRGPSSFKFRAYEGAECFRPYVSLCGKRIIWNHSHLKQFGM